MSVPRFPKLPKIVQIAAGPVDEGGKNHLLYALDADGTVWAAFSPVGIFAGQGIGPGLLGLQWQALKHPAAFVHWKNQGAEQPVVEKPAKPNVKPSRNNDRA